MSRSAPATRSRRRPAADPLAAAPSSVSAATKAPAAPTVRPSGLHEPPQDRSTALIAIKCPASGNVAGQPTVRDAVTTRVRIHGPPHHMRQPNERTPSPLTGNAPRMSP